MEVEKDMKAYLTNGTVSISKDEAINLAEGTPIIEGTFEETTSAWTGTFTSDCGQVYEIIDGYILKEVA